MGKDVNDDQEPQSFWVSVILQIITDSKKIDELVQVPRKQSYLSVSTPTRSWM